VSEAPPSAPTGADPTGADDVAIELDAVQVGIAAGVGRVVAAGEHATGLLDRRVLIGPIDPCGECDVCRFGGAAVCPFAVRRDALGRRTTAAARWLIPLGDGLELPLPAAAAVAGDVALAYTLYARAGVAPREPVAVVGVSPIVRFLIEILIAKGIAPIAVAAPGPWTDWALGKGIAVAHDRGALAAAFASQSLGTRPWRVICGDPAATATAVALAGPRASLTVLAHPALPAVLGEALAREVMIVGVAAAHPDLVVEAAAMCVKAEIDLVAGTTQRDDEPFRTQIRTLH
jgi:D-arabinose 1-dehydrogenase-like Zn-dependent alcohol dehydrogenase